MGFNAETGEVVAQTLTEAKYDDASQANALVSMRNGNFQVVSR
jgi:hypothetical protein